MSVKYQRWREWKYRHISEWAAQKQLDTSVDKQGLAQALQPKLCLRRQAGGKTTGLKLLVKDLIKSRAADPKSVFYMDYVVSLAEFCKIIESVLVEKRRRKVQTAYVFLDEVTAIEDWWRIIKYYVDRG